MAVYGVDDLRTIRERYSYFMRGRQLIIIEHKLSTDLGINNEPSYQAPTGGGETLTGSNEGKTGRKDMLMLEYTAIPDVAELLNEADEIPIHDTMALAIVDYIKAQLIDDPKNFNQRDYLMARFDKRIAEYTNARVGGIRRVIGQGF
tara:strand:- start:905 stop:1345 length:441 start_codon:yes stop_codon:yes gene_type:complete